MPFLFPSNARQKTDKILFIFDLLLCCAHYFWGISMRFFYSVFFYLIMPLVVLRLWIKSFAAKAYAKRWKERFGFVEHSVVSGKKVIWIHTVSVGEFLGALPLIRELQKFPDYSLHITTTTVTGSERVLSTSKDSVVHSYSPYDLPGSVSRFIKRVNPSMLIIMETELWPNWLAACRQKSIPSVLINARLSEKSAKGYARFSWLTRPMLQDLSLAAVQQKPDAERFNALGLTPEKTKITGNIKFDISLDELLRQKAQRLKQDWDISSQRLVVMAASTHQGEDEIILDAFSKVRAANNPFCKSARLILVPRHPERFDSVAQLIQQAGWKMARRSQAESFADADTLLGDTMGELMLLYGVSHLAFVGGSLVERGGHNFIEPAAWSLPLQSGEHLFNFSEVSNLMQNANALVVVKSSDELADEWIHLLNDADLRNQCGQAAHQVVVNNRGALQKTLEIIKQFLS